MHCSLGHAVANHARSTSQGRLGAGQCQQTTCLQVVCRQCGWDAAAPDALPPHQIRILRQIYKKELHEFLINLGWVLPWLTFLGIATCPAAGYTDHSIQFLASQRFAHLANHRRFLLLPARIAWHNNANVCFVVFTQINAANPLEVMS